MENISGQKLRLVTAASLFDGHDAAINIMRRIMQAKGAEIIHLGHNRSVAEIVECAIEEDVQGIAVTSYQGGHVEFFKYMKDLLVENGCGHIKIFGGGGGTILPSEIQELHEYGITRIYSPDDGRKMGLEGMIEDLIAQCKVASNGSNWQQTEFWQASRQWNGKLPMDELKDIRKIGRAISWAETGADKTSAEQHAGLTTTGTKSSKAPVLGITGTGGAGKSSVTDEILRRFIASFPRQNGGRHFGGSLQEENRRRIVGRQDQDERHSPSARLHEKPRHSRKRQGAECACERSDRDLSAGCI